MSSNRGFVVCKAYVTKRIKPLMVDGKPTHTIGMPIHWGFTGAARKGFGANMLTPFVGDANSQTPEFKAFLVERREDRGAGGLRESAHGRSPVARLRPPLRLHRDAAAGPRRSREVAKLIDVSAAASAARPARRPAWSGTTCASEVGIFEGSYDNPADLTPATWTLMRFTEWENPKGDLEWLIRKDGCMHCEDPGCLKACPSPGAIVQYANGIVDFISENCIGCGYCIKGCPFNIPRISQADQKAYKCTLCSRPRRGRPGAGLRQGVPDRRDHVRHQGRHDRTGPASASRT